MACDSEPFNSANLLLQTPPQLLEHDRKQREGQHDGAEHEPRHCREELDQFDQSEEIEDPDQNTIRNAAVMSPSSMGIPPPP